VGRAVEQIMSVAEIQPTFVALHPNDWWDMRLTKDNVGRCILGDPQQRGAGAQSNPFDLVPVPTTSMQQGTFLVGSGDQVASEIRDRMEIQVEVSTEHSDYEKFGRDQGGKAPGPGSEAPGELHHRDLYDLAGVKERPRVGRSGSFFLSTGSGLFVFAYAYKK
jgi:hypothetical protein